MLYSRKGPELDRFSRKAFAIVASALSGFLLWYSICTCKLSGENPSGVGNFSAHFFPEALVLNGQGKYLSLDPAGAARCYKKAILAEPSLIDAWMGLVRAEIANGKKEEAGRVLSIISGALVSISTWKCQELLFACDLHDGPYFEKCYNFILSYLPHHIEEASWIGSGFWGGWQKVVPHVWPCNRPVFLKELIERKQTDAAVTLLAVMEEEGPALKESVQLQFCDFLIANDRIGEARKVWRPWEKNNVSLIHDGRFETEPLNMAFGWRVRQDPDVPVERTSGPPCSQSCLHIHFKGLRNVDWDLASQIIPVKPETSYRLLFTRKSSDLSTDRGVFLEIGGLKNEKLNAASKQVTGESPWKEERLEFATPPGCEAVILRVRRNESLRMDNKISGDYWLGPVELTEKYSSPAARSFPILQAPPGKQIGVCGKPGDTELRSR